MYSYARAKEHLSRFLSYGDVTENSGFLTIEVWTHILCPLRYLAGGVIVNLLDKFTAIFDVAVGFPGYPVLNYAYFDIPGAEDLATFSTR